MSAVTSHADLAARREQVAQWVERWARWLGSAPRRLPVRGTDAPSTYRMVASDNVPTSNTLARMVGEGAEYARSAPGGPRATPPRRILADGSWYDVRDWATWPTSVQAEYRDRYGSPSRRNSVQAWASSIHGEGAHPASPVPAGVLELDRAIAGLEDALFDCLVAEHWLGGTAEERALTLRISVRSYWRWLAMAYDEIGRTLEGGG